MGENFQPASQEIAWKDWPLRILFQKCSSSIESKTENLKKHLSLGLAVMIYLQHRVKLLNQFIKSMNI